MSFNADFPEIFRNPPRYRIEPFKILGNVYYVGNRLVSVHLIDTGDGLILIDTAFPQTRAMLIESIWEAGFDPRDIRYIIHTHGHVDHIGATNLLKFLAPKAQTVLHHADAEMFQKKPALSCDADNEYPYSSLFTPDIFLSDGDVLTLGDISIRFVHTPGHCPGVVSFFFDVEENGTTYRLGQHGGSGLNTMCRKFCTLYDENLDENRKLYVESIQRLRSERVDVVLGNHPQQNNTFEKHEWRISHPDCPNPFIDPTEWQRFLDGLLVNFNRMVADGD